MSSASLFIALVFFLPLLSLQTQGRESQFFNKYNADDPLSYQEKTPIKTSIPYKEPMKHEEEPTFVRETGNGYGLYGHEYGEIPPQTTDKEKKDTSDTVPYTATSLSESHEPYPYNNYVPYPNNQKYEEIEGNTRFTGNNKRENRNYAYERDGYGRMEKEGMSDTRFLENGKYFYDIENEKYSEYPSRNREYYPENFGSRGYYKANDQNQQFMEEDNRRFEP